MGTGPKTGLLHDSKGADRRASQGRGSHRRATRKDPYDSLGSRPSREPAERGRPHSSNELITAIGVAEDANPRFRRSMEDAHDSRVPFPVRFGSKSPSAPVSFAYFGVYDGHGGQLAAQIIEKLLGDTVCKHISAADPDLWSAGVSTDVTSVDSGVEEGEQQFTVPMQKVLSESFVECGSTLRAKLEEANHDKSGSTAVAAVIAGNDPASRVLHCANVGDARTLLCRKGGHVERLSFDHKASDATEKARLEAKGALVIRGKVIGALAVSRAFGDPDFGAYVTADPFCASVKLLPGDTHVILACDGLFDVASDEEVCEFAQRYALKHGRADTDGLSKALVNYALEHHSTDNVTVMAIAL